MYFSRPGEENALGRKLGANVGIIVGKVDGATYSIIRKKVKIREFI